MVSIIFYFHPYLGKWSNLTNIFRRLAQRHSPQGVIESPGVGYSKRLLGQPSTKFQWNNSIFALCAFDTLSVLSLPWVRRWPFCGPAFVRQQVHSLWIFSAFSLGLITGVSGTKTLVDQHRPFHFSGRTCLTTRSLWSSIRRSQQLHCLAWLDWFHYPLADWSLGHGEPLLESVDGGASAHLSQWALSTSRAWLSVVIFLGNFWEPIA